jgi:Mn-containing catalase
MDQLRDLLVDELQDLLHAETQLVEALPNMAEAAHSPMLREAFEKHLRQTREHVERVKSAFELLGEKAQPRLCKGMQGLIAEGKERIEGNKELEDLAADLCLIAAAQKIEHYEISGYGTLRYLARQIGERKVATLLSQILGEEESADYLLNELAKPLLQEANMVDNRGQEAILAKAKGKGA